MITLSPIKQTRVNKWDKVETVYYESVIMIADGYPFNIVHIDTFSGPESRDIYNRLNAGEVVTVSLVIQKDGPSEEDKKEAERVTLAILAGMPT